MNKQPEKEKRSHLQDVPPTGIPYKVWKGKKNSGHAAEHRYGRTTYVQDCPNPKCGKFIDGRFKRTQIVKADKDAGNPVRCLRHDVRPTRLRGGLIDEPANMLAGCAQRVAGGRDSRAL